MLSWIGKVNIRLNGDTARFDNIKGIDVCVDDIIRIIHKNNSKEIINSVGRVADIKNGEKEIVLDISNTYNKKDISIGIENILDIEILNTVYVDYINIKEDSNGDYSVLKETRIVDKYIEEYSKQVVEVGGVQLKYKTAVSSAPVFMSKSQLERGMFLQGDYIHLDLELKTPIDLNLNSIKMSNRTVSVSDEIVNCKITASVIFGHPNNTAYKNFDGIKIITH